MCKYGFQALLILGASLLITACVAPPPSVVAVSPTYTAVPISCSSTYVYQPVSSCVGSCHNNCGYKRYTYPVYVQQNSVYVSQQPYFYKYPY